MNAIGKMVQDTEANYNVARERLDAVDRAIAGAEQALKALTPRNPDIRADFAPLASRARWLVETLKDERIAIHREYELAVAQFGIARIRERIAEGTADDLMLGDLESFHDDVARLSSVDDEEITEASTLRKLRAANG